MTRLHLSPRELPHEAFPRGLQDLSDPPERLFVAGELPERLLAVALVGTRAADPEPLRFAHRLAFDLTRAGVLVVSGGALGIDAAAHRGALDAGGPTVAVLASGLRRAYPPQHVSLFEQVAEQGALLCEHEDVTPHRGRFLERNRLVAAMCDAVVVVQAPDRSGALNTAATARVLGRLVFAVPAAPWDLRSRGSTSLLVRRDALALQSAADLMELLDSTIPIPAPVLSSEAPRSRSRQHPPSRRKASGTNSSTVMHAARTARAAPVTEKRPRPTFSRNAEQVLAHLSSSPTQRDTLVACTGLSVPALQSALLELILADEARELPDGRVALAGVR